MRWTRNLTVAGAAATLVAAGLGPAAAGASTGSRHQSSAPVVVVSGLNNPRQLSLVQGKQLLIAEAGKGGTEVTIDGPEGPSGLGATGSISSVWRPSRAHDQSPHRIVTGLLSGASPDGSFATGSDGVSSRKVYGPIYIQETFFPTTALSAALARQNGWLLKARAGSNHLKQVADITGFERTADPDRMGFDSDPYAVLALKNGELVADAAANDVLRVDRHGNVSVFHVFHNVTTGACATQEDPPGFPGCNFVPTSLATDRHGHVFVGGLSSLTPGEAQVVELSRNGKHVLRTWGGFSAVTGVAVAKDGTLYVSELFATEANPIDPMVTGVLTKVDRHGNRTHIDVPFAAGLALDQNGRDDRDGEHSRSAGDDRHKGHGNTVYVSAWSVAPENGLTPPGGTEPIPGTSGQVWRLHF
jgi:hypothetical protein